MNEQENTVNPSTWIDDYGNYLFRYAQLRLGNVAAAEDAVQETFLAGIKALDRFDGRVPIKFWLRGILRNKIVDSIRKAAREDSIDQSDDPEYVDTLLFRIAGIPERRPSPLGFDPHIDMEKSEFWEILEGCLDRLSGNARRAFTLKAIDGMASGEICKVLGITPNNLWVLTHRAREQLKGCLRKNWIESGENGYASLQNSGSDAG